MKRTWFLMLVALLAPACLIDSGTLVVNEADEPIVINTEDAPDATSSTVTTQPPGDTPETPPIPSDPQCGAGQLMCDGVCTPVVTNDSNCGTCGATCDGGRVCMDSACACEVGEFCGGACVDTTASSAHCGRCDNPCAGGSACVAGSCMVVGEVEGVLLATNAARAVGADCGTAGTFGPAGPLEGDPNLHLAAQAHADDMAANDFFDHTGSDGSSFVDRIGRTAFSGQPIGENIAAGNRTAEATVQQWLDSDGHCANMMNPSATKLGVGYALGGPYGTLWVQVFAR